MKNNITNLAPCPFCGGESVISFLFERPYITPIHTKRCKIKCDTWLISHLPIKKQIKHWNRRYQGEK